MMIRAEINQTEMKKTIERINETKHRLLEKIKLINLQPYSSRKKDTAQMNKFRNEREVTTDPTEI